MVTDDRIQIVVHDLLQVEGPFISAVDHVRALLWIPATVRGDDTYETVIFVFDIELSGTVLSDSLEEIVHFSTCLVFLDHNAIADGSQRVLESFAIIRCAGTLIKPCGRIERLVQDDQS